MKFEIPTDLAYRIFASVSLAMCEDKTREHMHGVYVRVGDCRLTVVATNGHWLTKYECLVPAASEAGEFTIAGAHVEALVRTLRKERKSPTPFVFEDGRVTLGAVTLHLGPASGKFPPFEQVIPPADRKQCGAVGVSTEYLAKVAKAFELAGFEGVHLQTGPTDLDPILCTVRDCPLLAVVVPRREEGMKAKAPKPRGRKAKTAREAGNPFAQRVA